MLAKSKLNSIDVLISEALIDSVISHDEFFLINHRQKEYDKITEEIKKLKTSSLGLSYAKAHQRFLLTYETILSYYLMRRKNMESKNPKVARTKNGRIMLLSKCAVCDSKKI